MMNTCVVCGQPAICEYRGQWYCEEHIRTVAVGCQVFSRIVGYLTPVESWNAGKAQEFKDRRVFTVPGDGNGHNARP